MKKIVIDAGHGLPTPGKRSPDGEQEWLFNDQVARAVIEQLSQYKNVQILRVDDETGGKDVPLKTRTNKANAWHADLYISIHHNAFNNVWGNHGGVECYTMDHPKANPKSVEIAKLIQPRLVKVLGLKDRGIKQANFHVLRETKMPSVLTEGGFMDSIEDMKVLRDKTKLKAQGRTIVKALAIYFQLELSNSAATKKETSPVSETHAQAWEWAKKEGYLNGENPTQPLTREQFATVLKRYDDRKK